MSKPRSLQQAKANKNARIGALLLGASTALGAVVVSKTEYIGDMMRALSRRSPQSGVSLVHGGQLGGDVMQFTSLYNNE